MKSKRKYFITSIFVLLLFTIVFCVKEIFPFGNNSVVWSDMHEQVVAMYYHFYDAIKGNGSLLIDFTSGGGINFVGIMAYYIMSPITLILLFFPRDMIIQGVSLVVVLKFLLSSISCLYFISKYFKKVSEPYQILLSLLYAFSGYSLTLYIITSWMDIVYLFPFLMVGLRKLLDLEGNKFYIIILSLCLICCYYLSFMILIFIIFVSFIYLYIYNKKNIKRSIFNLGVSTVISMLISSFVLVPTFLQMFSSQRVGFDISLVTSSGFGPLSDKIAFFFASGILISFVLLLLFNFKKHKKFILFLLPILIILCLPVVIEPINKMWHFGSYVYFPYRYGFITMFMLIVGASYYLANVDYEIKIPLWLKKSLPYVGVFISVLAMLFLVVKYRIPILDSIDSLTLTKNKKVLIALFGVFVLVLGSSLCINIYGRNKKCSVFLIFSLMSVNILFNLYFYIGGFDLEENLEYQYKQMLAISNDSNFKDAYYLKEVEKILISNYGMVTGINTRSNFTSLIDKNNFLTMQRLGYDSFWMDTRGLGGNLFSDIVLGNKYLVSSSEYNDSYYDFLYSKEGLNYYKFSKDMSYGYILNDNLSIEDAKNSFEASNIIYNSITGKKDIFDIKNLFSSDGVTNNNYESGVIIEENINITGRKRVYLEIFSYFDNKEKSKNYDSFDVYVNDKLVYEKVPNIYRNGTLLLGEYENENVVVKIVSLNESTVRNITLGELDLDKLNDFIDYQNVEINNLSFEKNKVALNVLGTKGNILYLPLTYLEGYFSNTHKIVPVFDNFVGVVLNDGVNDIELSYYPSGLMFGIILSIIGIVISIVWIKYSNNLDILILNNCSFYIYIILYDILLILLYIILPIIFIFKFIF